MQMQTVYLNGNYLPLSEAKVSVMDRGFLFGDGVYEVIPFYQGKIFQFEKHITRLRHSLKNIRLEINYDDQQWAAIFQGLFECNTKPGEPLKNEEYAYLQITRGSGPSREHIFPGDIQPTIFACFIDMPPLSSEKRVSGIAAITQKDDRWKRCDIKAITLLPNILAKQSAKDAGAAEAILINDGLAIEGCSSNLFIVNEGTIITPPIGPYILSGVTRNFVLELAAKYQLPIEERQIPEAELLDADEIWLTNSTREVMPVVLLNEKKINGGVPGPVWHQINDYFQADKIGD